MDSGSSANPLGRMGSVLRPRKADAQLDPGLDHGFGLLFIKAQRFAVEAGKTLEFEGVYSPFPAFTFVDA